MAVTATFACCTLLIPDVVSVDQVLLQGGCNAECIILLGCSALFRVVGSHRRRAPALQHRLQLVSAPTDALMYALQL